MQCFVQSHLKGASHAYSELQTLGSSQHWLALAMLWQRYNNLVHHHRLLSAILRWLLVLITYSVDEGRKSVEQIPSSSSGQEQQLCLDALKLGANPTYSLKNNHLFLGCWLPSPHPLCLQPALGKTVDEGGKKQGSVMQSYHTWKW